MASVSDTLSYAKKFSGYDYNKMVKAGMRSGNLIFGVLILLLLF